MAAVQVGWKIKEVNSVAVHNGEEFVRQCALCADTPTTVHAEGGVTLTFAVAGVPI